MSAALLDAPVAPLPSACRGGGAFRARRPTLEERLNATFAALTAAGAADCPVCHGPMQRDAGGGTCKDCGARLA